MTYTLTIRFKVPLDRADGQPRGTFSFFAPAPFMQDLNNPVQAGIFPLDRTTKAFEDLRSPFWRSATGSPKRWMPHSGRQIRLVPRSAVAVTVGYLEAPTALVNDADVPDPRIPVPHHAYLKFAAAAWLLRQDGDQQDEAKAQSFMQTFNSLIGASNG